MSGVSCIQHTSDGGLKCNRAALSKMGINLNFEAIYEHMIKRYIITVKERHRAIPNSLPFKRYLPRLIAEMV